MKLFQKIMKSKTPTPAEEIQRAIREIDTRRNEIDARLLDLSRNADCSGEPGKVRREAMLTGSPADIVALDREQRELIAERDQALPAQEQELRKRLDAARAAEAADALPGRIKALGPALARHEDAMQKLRAARDQVDELVSEILQARHAIGNDAPAVPLELVQTIATIKGIDDEPDRPDRYNLARARLYADLGAELPERARPDYSPFGGREARQAAAEQQERSGSRESFWDKQEPGGRAA